MHMYSGSNLLLRLVPAAAGASVAMRDCKDVRQACKAYSHIKILGRLVQVLPLFSPAPEVLALQHG